MNEAEIKAAVGRFLKHVNFTAQRELEKAIRNASAGGKLQSGESFAASVMLASEQIDLNVTIFSRIEIK